MNYARDLKLVALERTQICGMLRLFAAAVMVYRGSFLKVPGQPASVRKTNV